MSINECPTEAISQVSLDEYGTEQEIVIIQSQCIGCGACLVVCPVKVIDIRTTRDESAQRE